jgi:hypothetical protein
MSVWDDMVQLSQIGNDRTLVERVNAIEFDLLATRAQAITLLGENHPRAQSINDAAVAADDALTAAYEAIERFLQELVNAAGAAS